MLLTFLYDEKALLEYQLYIAGQSPIISKTRKRNRWLLALIYITIGVFGIFRGDLMFTILFIIIGILWYLFYPKWGGRFYKKQFSKFIKANYRNRLGKNVTLDFKDDEVVITEADQSATFLYDEFDSIVEIPLSFLIKLKSEVIMIIDKNATIPSSDIAAFLKDLAERYQISYQDDTNWAWK